ncbi:kinase-like domain-containing protein [Daldinia vernicosa]|uniref:kinase-like domain-containing protein n=1 Tax=Daldinia vernicosa TaxID=114800 RepID=UPI0020078528|nr:kinase-like domain-containing protein [Daldinia vernicosa]KAI0849181.1 kinase-like domain-containing protein [Daldinia vernicosa]
MESPYSPKSAYSESSRHSVTSTVLWDHDAFETYQFSVLEFALYNIWPGANLNDIIIERLKGGGFNRIIGLTRKGNSRTNSADVQYIVRIPRHDDARVDRDVATLEFLGRHTKISVPKVLTFDTTEDNELHFPYMIQDRIAGTDVLTGFPRLNHAKKLRFARELGNVFRQILAVRSHTAGSLVFSSEGNDIDIKAEFSVIPYGHDGFNLAVPYSSTKTTRQTIRDLLLSNFQDQMAHIIKYHPSAYLKFGLFGQLCAMVWELEERGLFHNVDYCLAHLDLAPRNILIDPTSTPKKPIISGVLDWDSAVFAPAFMACEPPLWVWGWLDGEDEDERTANDVPPTVEGRQLKKAFERAAGKDYMRFAYNPAYRLARRLVRFAIQHELQSNYDWGDVEVMLAEWKTVR